MIRDFIHTLGGPSGVAGALKAMGHERITDRAVVAWGIRDTVPWKWREPVADLAVEKDIEPENAPEEIRRFMLMPEAAE